MCITVACFPLADHLTWASVIASGSAAAESERNTIRSLIRGLQLH
jgi:hypothetical protein